MGELRNGGGLRDGRGLEVDIWYPFPDKPGDVPYLEIRVDPSKAGYRGIPDVRLREGEGPLLPMVPVPPPIGEPGVFYTDQKSDEEALRLIGPGSREDGRLLKIVRGLLHPNQGGCWFCHAGLRTDEDSMHFTTEFDAYFHMDCLKKALRNPEVEDPEAEIIGREFNVPVPEPSDI